MTGLSAAQIGIKNRGIIKPGAFADLVLFDPVNIIDKVFIVDDCCPENTGSYLKKKKLKKIEILILKKNLGVGGATMIGFKKAIKNNYDIIFKIDGDGQHDPKDITKFLLTFKMKNRDK